MNSNQIRYCKSIILISSHLISSQARLCYASWHLAPSVHLSASPCKKTPWLRFPMIEAIVYEQRNIFVSKLIDRRNFQTRPKYGINSVHYRTVKLKYCYIPFPIIESLCHCDHLFRLSLSRKRNRIAVSVITVCPQDKLRVGTAIQSTSIIRMCQNMTKCAVEQVGNVITVLALHKR